MPKTEEQEKTKNPFNQFISDYNFWEGVQLVRVRGTSDVYILSEGVAYKIDKLTRTALGFIEEYIHPISVEEFKKYPISPEGWNSYKQHLQWTRIFVRERGGLFVLFDNILYPIEKLYEREVLSEQGIAVISERLFPYIFAK